MSDTMRLLPREVLPDAERRAWTRRHPVRTALGHALLLTPFLALIVLLAPGLDWSVRFLAIALAGAATFAVNLIALRLRSSG